MPIFFARSFSELVSLILLGNLYNSLPHGIDKARQCVDPSIRAAAQPVGADAMADKLDLLSCLVMLPIVLVTNVLPVPGFPSTKINCDGGLS